MQYLGIATIRKREIRVINRKERVGFPEKITKALVTISRALTYPARKGNEHVLDISFAVNSFLKHKDFFSLRSVQIQRERERRLNK